MASPEEPDGTQLQLELNNDPAAKAFQQAKFHQGKPAAMFYVDDVQKEYDRMKGLGGELSRCRPPKVTGSTTSPWCERHLR